MLTEAESVHEFDDGNPECKHCGRDSAELTYDYCAKRLLDSLLAEIERLKRNAATGGVIMRTRMNSLRKAERERDEAQRQLRWNTEPPKKWARYFASNGYSADWPENDDEGIAVFAFPGCQPEVYPWADVANEGMWCEGAQWFALPDVSPLCAVTHNGCEFKDGACVYCAEPPNRD